MSVLCRLMLAVLLALSVIGTALADPPSCSFPPDLRLGGIALPLTQAAVAAHRPVTIVTLGGSSTAGVAANGAEYSYPMRLQAHLQALRPDLQVTVLNRAIPRGSTRARVDRLQSDVVELGPSLVIWAPGSIEAGNAQDPEEFAAILREGIARIRAAPADLILVDLLYTPSIARAVDLDRYNGILAEVAAEAHVPLVRRSALMRRWNDNGVFALDATPRREHVKTIRRLYDCFAAGVAEGLVAVLF
jgi:lysophospholipase L1-like esterase